MQTVHLTDDQPYGDAVEDIELMTANLLKIKREITERDQQQPLFVDDGNRDTLKHKIRNLYDQYLSHADMPSNHQDKLYSLMNRDLDVGTMVALFEMIYYFRQALNEEVLQQISAKAFKKLKKEKLSEAETTCIIELLAICGVNDEETVNYIVEAMIEEHIPFELCFSFLSNMGFLGLSTLIHLATQDFKQIPQKILDYLSRTQEIIKELIVPTLVSDLQTSKNKEKYIILSALNRMNSLSGQSTEIYPVLIEMLQNNTIDRGFVASVLRSSGMEGQKILLQFMGQCSKNEKILLPIISVLPWRVKQQSVLRMKVIEYSLGSNFLPGTLYQYEGKIQPSVFCFQEEDCCDSLCLNARDFLAALQRLLTAKEENCENEQSYRTKSPNNLKLFALHEIITSEKQQIQISSECVRSLVKCLHNESPQIREAALNSLGLIGLPQSFEAIESITKCLWDSNSKVRSMACWGISKLCEQPSKAVLHRLVELLKDNFWKVRVSACICLGSVGPEPYEFIIEGLMRCLRDNSVNKVTVCESLMKLGQIGEELLLEILKTTNNSDFKLKEAIIFCLREASIKSSTIDYVIEEIFKNCKGTRQETRILCLETLNHLRLRSVQEEEEIIYLKAKSILPFYYYFLEDSVPQIRQLAAEIILSFGGQAELIFIEGMTKGSTHVRVESAKGLAKLGVQNFRALILGLRDDDPKVRKIANEVILKNFDCEAIVGYYSKKTNQAAALLCNLKDILSNGVEKQMKGLLKEVIYRMEKHHQPIYDQNSLTN